MIPTPGPQTVESIVAFWICAPIALIFAVILAIAVWLAIVERDQERATFIGVAVTMALITAAIVTSYQWGMYPDDYVHHHWQRYTGTIATVATTLEKNTTTGVATFTADPQQPFYVRDTRIATSKPGQTLTVDCVLRYSGAGGKDWQDCKWVAVS